MSQPTKEQWVEITKNMDRIFSNVYLRCDEYVLSASMSRHKNKLIMEIYVNGVLKGKWCLAPESGLEEDLTDIQKRFCNVTWRNAWPRRLIADMEKILGMHEAKKRGYYKKIMRVSPWWPSAKCLVNHLKKHNKNIEVITFEEHEKALEALAEKAVA